MKRIAFIQSVSANEWEIGEIQSFNINNNPNYSNYYSEVFYFKTFQELKNMLMSIDCVPDGYIIIQISAHSNLDGIAFKDINSSNVNEYVEFVEWSNFNNILLHLYNRFGMSITLIFISCYSSSYVESIKSPHIPIIAAEGEIVSRRAGEHLSKFYENICAGACTKDAYNNMIESFPIEDELKRNEKDRSILKLYM